MYCFCSGALLGQRTSQPEERPQIGAVGRTSALTGGRTGTDRLAGGGVMKKGDLVRVTRPSEAFFPEDVHENGVVVDYRPNVLGGSSMVQYRVKGGWKSEMVKSPVRGEVLVLSYTDGGQSWYDEMNVKLI